MVDVSSACRLRTPLLWSHPLSFFLHQLNHPFRSSCALSTERLVKSALMLKYHSRFLVVNNNITARGGSQQQTSHCYHKTMWLAVFLCSVIRTWTHVPITCYSRNTLFVRRGFFKFCLPELLFLPTFLLPAITLPISLIINSDQHLHSFYPLLLLLTCTQAQNQLTHFTAQCCRNPFTLFYPSLPSEWVPS